MFACVYMGEYVCVKEYVLCLLIYVHNMYVMYVCRYVCVCVHACMHVDLCMSVNVCVCMSGSL